MNTPDQDGFEELVSHPDYRINMTTGVLVNKKGGVLGTKQNAGYIIVAIPSGKILLHRLVYLQRHGDIPAGLVIDHIDGNKTNNAISNLQAITTSENIKRAYKDKDLTGVVKLPISIIATNLETKVETTYPSLRSAQLKLGVANSSIRYCVDGKCKTALSKVDGKRYGFRAVQPPPASVPALS